MNEIGAYMVAMWLWLTVSDIMIVALVRVHRTCNIAQPFIALKVFSALAEIKLFENMGAYDGPAS